MPAILAIAYGSLVGSSGAAEQVLLADRLRAVARIDARAARGRATACTSVHPARLDDRGVNHQVVVDELRRARAVGEDAADRAGDEEDVLGPVRLEPVVHRRLIAKIQLLPRGAEDVGEARRLQPPHDRRTDQPAMSRDVHCSVARDLMCRHGVECISQPKQAQDSGQPESVVPASGLSSVGARLIACSNVSQR